MIKRDKSGMLPDLFFMIEYYTVINHTKKI